MYKRKGTPKKKKRSQVGIKWKMLAIILTFTVLFTLAIWIFQIQMLNYFYQVVRFHELDGTFNEINNVKFDKKKISSIAYDRAEDTYGDIWVYEIKDGTVNDDDCLIFYNGSHDESVKLLRQSFDFLYSEAKENADHYIGLFSMKELEEEDLSILDDNKGRPNSIPYISRNVRGMNAIRIDIISLSVGDELLVIQRADLEPMSALVNTVRTQVVFISTVLIVFGFILAIVMSKFITIPIIRINKSAKALGRGKYDVEFKGHNYREISELSDTLNYAAVELSKNDKLQKELISNISHDLRTPITMIRGYSEIMRDIPGEVTPENFQVIIDEAARLAELVDGMLDLSKLQAGVRVPNKDVFCLTEVIKSTLIRYEKLVTQESYKIDFVFEEDAFVCADRSMILQVVYNFINNAINYTGEDKYVCVEQKVADGVVHISITDTGEGISDEQIPYIWDRYYKVDKVHRRATVGTGLGLSIVKGVLEAHGANYGVVSEKGRGSTFYFELESVNPDDCDV